MSVYTNTDQVELFVNGKSQGRQVVDPYDRGYWYVPYQSGNLTVVGYNNDSLSSDTVVTRDTVITTGPAVGLKLTLDFPLQG